MRQEPCASGWAPLSDPSGPPPLCTDRSPGSLLQAGRHGAQEARFAARQVASCQGLTLRSWATRSLHRLYLESGGRSSQGCCETMGEEVWAAYQPHLQGRCVPMSLTWGLAPVPSGRSLGHQSPSLGIVAGLLGHPSRVLSQGLACPGSPSWAPSFPLLGPSLRPKSSRPLHASLPLSLRLSPSASPFCPS